MFSSRFSALSCSTRSAASASSRWRTNRASSPNTTAPATVTLSAIIVVANQAGAATDRPDELAREPRYEEHDDERDEPAGRRRTSLKTRAPSGARMPHRPTPPAATKPPNDHRDRRREQDVDQRHQEEPREVARAREHGDRTEQDGEVDERHHTDRRAEREVQRAPDQRDRQDQHGDQDEQRLSCAQVLVVVGVRADEHHTRRRAIYRRSDPSHEVHRGDVTRRASARPRPDAGVTRELEVR